MVGLSYLAFELLQNPKEGKPILNEFLAPTIETIKSADKIKAKDILTSVFHQCLRISGIKELAYEYY